MAVAASTGAKRLRVKREPVRPLPVRREPVKPLPIAMSVAMDADFESKHPRGYGGKFGEAEGADQPKALDVEGFLAANPRQPGEPDFEYQSRICSTLDPQDRHEMLFQLREQYEPVAYIADGVQRWRDEHGLPDPKVDLAEVRAPLEKGDTVARTFEEAADQSSDPKVQAAYEDFKRQSEEMYDFATRPESEGGLGIKVDFVTPEQGGFTPGTGPYKSAKEQADDLRDNHHITLESGLGGAHEATMSVGEYDRFRAVHDIFGHAAVGGGFDRHGEYQAYLLHRSMYEGDGAKAMASEYHGVNCVTPDTLVLTSDLRWVRAGDLHLDDELIGFEEQLSGRGRGGSSHLMGSRVERLGRKRLACYRVVTDRGEVTVSSGHGFVAIHRSDHSREWRIAENVRVGDRLTWTVEPWRTVDSRDGGYIAGLFDGEGWVTDTRVSFCQNPGLVLDEIQAALKRCDIDVLLSANGPKRTTTPNGDEYDNASMRLTVQGGRWSSMSFIGMFRPPRLLAGSRVLWEGGDLAKRGAKKLHGSSHATVTAVEYVGLRECVTLQTSSRTFIAAGFPSHNTSAWAGEPGTPGTGKSVLLPSDLIADPFDEEGNFVHLAALPVGVRPPAKPLTRGVVELARRVGLKAGGQFAAEFDRSPWHYPPAATVASGDFDESKHPRDERGRFGEKTGESDPVANRDKLDEHMIKGTKAEKPPEGFPAGVKGMPFGPGDKQAVKAEIVDARSGDLVRMLDERPELKAEFDRQMAFENSNGHTEEQNLVYNAVYYDVLGRSERGDKDAMAAIVAQTDIMRETGKIDMTPVLAYAEEHDVPHPPVEELWAKDTAQRYVDAWADSAADTNAVSLAGQAAVAEELGVSSPSFDRYVTDLAANDRTKFAAEDMRSTQDFERETMKAFARSEYDATQKALADLGLKPDDEIELYRGMKFEAKQHMTGDIPPGFPPPGGADTHVPVDLNPASSWTIDRATANSPFFSGPTGFVLTDHVKVSDIISTARTGRGALGEAEVRVLNRHDREATVHSNANDPFAPGSGGHDDKLVAAASKRVYIDDPRYGWDDWIKHAAVVASGDFDESKHPRDERGRFGDKGGGAPDGLELLGDHPPFDMPELKDQGMDAWKIERDTWAMAWDREAAAAKQAVAEDLAQRMTTPTEQLVEAAGYANNWQNGLAFIGRDDKGRIWTVPEVLMHDRNGDSSMKGVVDETGEGHAVRFGWDMHDLVRCDSPEAEPLFREMSAASMVDLWSVTSGDSDPDAIAIQQAAHEEFGLHDRAFDALGDYALSKEAHDTYAEKGDVYRDFVRSQYQATQTRLAEEGVKELTLYRGFVWADSDGRPTTVPGWARDEGRTDMEARPLSSWSANRSTAESFADSTSPEDTTLIKATIPADQILSYPRTGMGSLKEGEFVALGGIRSVDVIRPATAPDPYIRPALSVAMEADFDESKHPRDSTGKFTSGDGEPGTKTEDVTVVTVGGEPEGKGTKDDPIRTGDPEVAAKALADGKYVELDQPRTVSTLLDKIKQYADEARAKGGKVPDYDLCRASVAGTNLFCAGGPGVPRQMMPQLSGKAEPGGWADRNLEHDARGGVNAGPAFQDYLEGRGFKVTEETVPAEDLRASQRTLDGDKVAGIADRLQNGGDPLAERPVFVTKDDYVIDGHHRWAATVANGFEEGKPLPMKVLRVDAPVLQVLAIANNWTKSIGMQTKAHGQFALDGDMIAMGEWSEELHPRDERGRFGNSDNGANGMPVDWGFSGGSEAILEAAAAIVPDAAKAGYSAYPDAAPQQVADAVQMIDTVNNAPIAEQEMFSGHHGAANPVAAWEEGDEVSIPLMSITPERALAADYADAHGASGNTGYGAGILRKDYELIKDSSPDLYRQIPALREETQVMLRFDGPRAAHYREDEYITSGRFKVEKVETVDRPDDRMFWDRERGWHEGTMQETTLRYLGPVKVDESLVASVAMDADFESKHPRGEGGKFGDKDGTTDTVEVKRYETFEDVKATPGFEERLGNCYQEAARYVAGWGEGPNGLPREDTGRTLVHGSIQGDGAPRIDHAWAVNPDGTVHDAVLGLDFHPDDWERLAHPEVRKTYDDTEAKVQMVRNGHWGPWDK